MSTQFSFCRTCSGYCGVEITEENGELNVSGDRANPKNAGHICDSAQASLVRARSDSRISQPLKREGGELVPVSWEEAISAIGGQLKGLRKKHGGHALALYAGSGLASNSYGALRTAAFAVGLGTPHLYSDLTLHGAPQLFAAEQMLGIPMALQADVGRAHYTLLLGDCDQDIAGWGPLQSGTIHTQALKHIQKSRRSAKLVAVGSRRTALADLADDYIAIRPGTETVFLLGLCHATWAGGWIDHQYLEDYCTNTEGLAEVLAPWTPAVVAEICGTEASKVSGVALKFSRAPMATVAKSRALFNHEHGTVAAWAWHLLHAMTANLLRPGGAFEAVGTFDLLPALVSFPTENAPRSRVSGYPAMLLQMPSTALLEEIRTQGKGQIRGLICVDGDPLLTLPQPGELRHAFSTLNILVSISSHHSAITALADWVLPSLDQWEQKALHLLDGPTLPYKHIQASSPVLSPGPEVRATESILADLFEETGAPLFGGAWGSHLRTLGRWLAKAPLDKPINRLLRWATDLDESQLQALPHGLDQGELDRALWRAETPGERINMLPEDLESSIRSLRPQAREASSGFLLNSTTRLLPGASTWTSRADASLEGIRVHPDAGFTDGQEIRVATTAGALSGKALLDERLHPESVLIPWNRGVEVGLLVPPDQRDPLTGTPQLSGVPCTIEAI